MVGIEDLYLMNIFITVALFVATLYRIKIERDHTKAMLEEFQLKKKIKMLRDALTREKDIIENMKTKKDISDFYNFLMESLRNNED
jgi:hypothetical protein